MVANYRAAGLLRNWKQSSPALSQSSDILNEQSSDASDADTNESALDETDDDGVEQQSIASTTPQSELSPATRRVKLRNTLDIYHYVNARRVREIVAAGREIVVDSPEVADLIAADHVYAL